MFDDLNLSNCPEEFALNCKRYETHCHECKANGAGKYLKYLPIDKSMSKHPADNKQQVSKKITSYARRGRSDEQKIIDKWFFLNRTVGSGMVGGDGDAYISLPMMNKVRVEVKCRYTDGGYIYPSAAEIREGKTQGIKLWLIFHKKKNLTMVYVDFSFLSKLWQALVMNEKLRWDVDYVPEHKAFHMVESSGQWNHEFYIRNDVKALPKDVISLGYSMCQYIVDKEGVRLVGMNIKLFEEMIGLYTYGIR